MTFRKSLLLAGASLALPFTFISPADAAGGQALAPMPAADSQPAATSSAGAQPGVSEIVVTALKRAGSVQAIPASITAVSGQTALQTGITDLGGLAKVVPNLNWGEHFGTTVITLRGIGSNVDSGVTEPTVAMYVDGVYLPRSDMATLNVNDLERAEVLRGPQGTLYGRNATGGAVNLVSVAPSTTFKAGASVSAGDRSQFGVDAYLTGPIAPDLYLRLSGGHDYQEGYVQVDNPSGHKSQDLGGTNDTHLHGALRWTPTDKLTADLSVMYDRNTAATAYQELFEESTVIPAALQDNRPNHIIADIPYTGVNQTLLINGTLKYNLSDHWTIRSVTGYVDHKSDYQVDDDGSGAPVEYTDDFRRPSRSVSEDVDLLGDYQSFKWILGAFYYHENADTNLPVNVPGVGRISEGVSSSITNEAVYGDGTWSITSRLRLNIGLRYNHENNDYLSFWSFEPLAGPQISPFKTDTDKFLPKVALQYDFTSTINGYAQWSVGYKSGGANFPNGSTGAELPAYKAENLNAYELGLKSQWFDRRVTANVAAFYYNYKDLQETTTIPPDTSLVQNANAKVYGIEGDFRWNVTPQFSVNLAPTYLNARFVDFSALDPIVGAVVDLNGKSLPRAPDFTVNAGAQYRIDIDDNYLSSLTFQGSVVYSSKVVLDYFNDLPGEAQAPYAVGNLSATLVDASRKTRLSLFVNNVGDVLYKQEVINFGLGNMGNYGPPRTFGVRISRDF